METKLDEAFSLLNRGEAAEAITLVKPLARSLEVSLGQGNCQATDQVVYYDFADSLSGFIFLARTQEHRSMQHANKPFARIFSLCGQALLIQGKTEEALREFSKAVEWDPASPSLYFLLAQSLYALGDIPQYLSCLEKAFPQITRPEDLAYYQCEKGRYLLQEGQVDRGIANIQMSTRWAKTDKAVQTLMDAAQTYGQRRVRMDESTVAGVLIAAGDPILPSEETLQTLIDAAKEATTRKQFDIALDAVSRVLAFVPDDNLSQQKEQLLALKNS